MTKRQKTKTNSRKKTCSHHRKTTELEFSPLPSQNKISFSPVIIGFVMTGIVLWLTLGMIWPAPVNRDEPNLPIASPPPSSATPAPNP